MPPKKQIYKHLDQRNQILLRPGQHITGTELVSQDTWVYEKNLLVPKYVKFNTGLKHIFYEVLSNAQDNYFRSKDGDTPLKKIEVTLEDNKITIWNDGNHIPTVVHEWQDGEEELDTEVYEAELIFGYLNSSGNYDDEKQARMGAGLHGVGVKLTNIFSKEFTVKTNDPINGLSFNQTFYDNMSRRDKPKIKKSTGKKGWTEVSYTADFSRFNCEGYSKHFESLVKKMCVDCAMITGAKISYNGEQLPVKNLLDYAQHFAPGSNAIEFSSSDSNVVVVENPQKVFKHIAFTNGVLNPDGGVHVDEWTKSIFKPLLEKLKKKYSKGKSSNPLKLTLKQLLDHFMIIINCNLQNPHFAGQTKARLNSPKPKTPAPEAKINKMMKWDFISDIEDMIKLQSMKDLKKMDGKKMTTVSVDGLSDANKAGGRDSLKCILFVTEGLSAKTIAVKGRGIVKDGNDYYGAFPLKGKPLNVQDKSAQIISSNKEIQNLTKALGLRTGVDYKDPDVFKTLRYGKMCAFCDADHDGTHIKGLIKNILRVLYPTLLETDFLVTLKTPIVKAKIGKTSYEFYDQNDFKAWVKENPSYKAKYYKGLGTTTDAELPDIFLKPKWIQYNKDDDAFKSIDKAFGQAIDSAGRRKKWLEEYCDDTTDQIEKVYNKHNHEIIPISDFINKELIQFSIYDNQRSIPNVVDGMKISQRKAIWTALHTLNTKDDYKVAQFAADVAKKSEYHHGEVSMEGTIIGLAQTFVGSNNIPVLDERGQFGSVLASGKDHASSRYIFTRLTALARCIFRKEDDPILRYLEDEGKSIEPKFFVPVIPLLLANGCNTGIGTGFSTHVPNYNPIDLINWIRNWLNNERGKDNIPPYDKLIPWYRGFGGTTKVEKTTVTHTGNVDDLGKNVYYVRELPVKLAAGGTDKCRGFVDRLVAMKDKKIVTKYEEHGTAYKPQYRIFSNKKLSVKDMGLVKTESLNNLTAFGPKGGLHKYASVEDIMREYCDVRYYYYKKRKKYLLKSLNIDLQELTSRIRFIKHVLKDVTVLKQSEESLFEFFEENDYYKKEDSYRYLTDIPIRNFTKDKMEALKTKLKELESQIEYVQNTSATEMWQSDLDELEHEYEKWLAKISKK
jgi:DNA topoisomerase-2